MLILFGPDVSFHAVIKGSAFCHKNGPFMAIHSVFDFGNTESYPYFSVLEESEKNANVTQTVKRYLHGRVIFERVFRVL